MLFILVVWNGPQGLEDESTYVRGMIERTVKLFYDKSCMCSKCKIDDLQCISILERW